MTIDRLALIAAVESLHDWVAERDWAETEQLTVALGWPEHSDEGPDSAWLRARLEEAIR